MTQLDQLSVQNYLLRKLPPEAFDFIAPSMEVMDLPLRHVLVEENEPNKFVCFLEQGLGSVVASTTDDEYIEISHVGYEGVTGIQFLLKTDIVPNRTFMQVAGVGIKVPVEIFKEMVNLFPPAHDMFLRYIHTSEQQLAHSALANARYGMHERLARWLLMCHDRLRSNDLTLTHEFLALMLGVRRAGVTNEIHVLEGTHAIKATRGLIRIVDRAKLEEIAGGCYGVPEKEYERLIGNPFTR